MRYLPLAALAVVSAVPAHAQDEADGAAETAAPLSVSGNATLTSDYRFRGVSQTGGDMAVQGGITLAHESGVNARKHHGARERLAGRHTLPADGRSITPPA